MDTIDEGKRVARRRHDAELKARVVAECSAPGASVAGVALEHGLNANLVHRWLRIAEGREGAGRPGQRSEQFIALPMAAAAVTAVPADIRIEFKRGPSAVNVTWPCSAAAECATWLRELLR